ncbi:MAG: 6-phosphogluconolactonase, partial [Alistipes sp.]|nr:6-phosphogluconolactonase [Alistipes sp.]
MKITVANSERDFDLAAASRIVNTICVKPRSLIGLSTGRTTGNVHRAVCEIHTSVDFDVSQVTVFGLDEVTGVPREYFGACYTMLRTEFCDPLGIPDDRLLMLPVASDDFDTECRRFTAEIESRGGIDLLILGLGENGHLGFNQPGTPFDSSARLGSMETALETRIRRETGIPAEKPLGGVTLGIRDIMHARRIVLVAKGDNKREIVKAMFDSPISPD